jgi:hypothetical protein
MGGWSERVMGQTGFFDVERRLEAISAKGDSLETIKKIVQRQIPSGMFERALVHERPAARQRQR